jgi:hypothetical protein
VRGQGEVGVPTHAHPRRVRPDHTYRLVDPLGRVLVAGDVAGPVDQVKHLPGVGQRDHQRVVAPDPLVRDAHAGLAFARGGHHRAVHVEIDHLAEQVPASRPPQRRPHRVDRLQQRHDVGFVESAQEVPGRGRIRQQFRTQAVHQRHIVAVTVDVFQPGAAGEHVVGQIQDVVGLGVGHVHRQQVQAGVNTPHQADTREQTMHREQPAKRRRLDVATDLVADLSCRQHRLRPRTPVPCQPMPGRHPTPTARRVPPALLERYPLHHKGLLLPGCVASANPAR